MAFAVITPAGQVELQDLPLEVLDDIEEKSGQRWPTILAAPATTARAARVIYEAACRHVGCEPEKLTARTILDGRLFVQVDDDLPTLFEDGMPDPKAEDEAPTDGSSPASGGGDGPPT